MLCYAKSRPKHISKSYCIYISIFLFLILGRWKNMLGRDHKKKFVHFLGNAYQKQTLGVKLCWLDSKFWTDIQWRTQKIWVEGDKVPKVHWEWNTLGTNSTIMNSTRNKKFQKKKYSPTVPIDFCGGLRRREKLKIWAKNS